MAAQISVNLFTPAYNNACHVKYLHFGWIIYAPLTFTFAKFHFLCRISLSKLFSENYFCHPIWSTSSILLKLLQHVPAILLGPLYEFPLDLIAHSIMIFKYLQIQSIFNFASRSPFWTSRQMLSKFLQRFALIYRDVLYTFGFINQNFHSILMSNFLQIPVDKSNSIFF